MSVSPELSIIIPWCNRPEISTSLMENSSAFKKMNAEVIVVGCGTSKSKLRASVRDAPARKIHIGKRKFNKCFAQNIGVTKARAKNILLLDADILIDEFCLRKGLDALISNQVVTIKRVRDIDSGLGRQAMARSHVYEYVHEGIKYKVRASNVFSNGDRSGPGLIFLKRSWFTRVGGMSSDLTGWGWEDIDLIFRLLIVLQLPRVEIGKVWHMPSVRSQKSDADREASEAANIRRCIERYRDSNFNGTLVKDESIGNALVEEL